MKLGRRFVLQGVPALGFVYRRATGSSRATGCHVPGQFEAVVSAGRAKNEKIRAAGEAPAAGKPASGRSASRQMKAGATTARPIEKN
jgi:hypothetical protein